MRQLKQRKEVLGCANTSVVSSQASSESGKNIWTWWHFSVISAERGRPGAHWPVSPAYWRVADQWETLSQKEKVDGQDRRLSSVLHTFCDTPTSQKERKVRRLASTTEGRGREMVADRREKQERRRGREKLSLAFSSEEMVSLSLEIKLHTCSMPRLRNSSLSTTSAKCRSVEKPERDHQHHTSEEATSLDQPETRKCHRISSGREEVARRP